jgi:hypothetical protein
VPFVGEPVFLAIAFERRVIEVRGVVQHVRERPWGSIVGIAFEESAHTDLARRCLERIGGPGNREPKTFGSDGSQRNADDSSPA